MRSGGASEVAARQEFRDEKTAKTVKGDVAAKKAMRTTGSAGGSGMPSSVARERFRERKMARKMIGSGGGHNGDGDIAGEKKRAAPETVAAPAPPAPGNEHERFCDKAEEADEDRGDKAFRDEHCKDDIPDDAEITDSKRSALEDDSLANELDILGMGLGQADVVPGAVAVTADNEASSHPPLTQSPSYSAPPSHEIEVVATLVEPAQDAETAQDVEEGFVAVAVAQHSKCGIILLDRRVKFAACFVLVIIVALAAGLGIALGRGQSSSGSTATEGIIAPITPTPVPSAEPSHPRGGTGTGGTGALGTSAPFTSTAVPSAEVSTPPTESSPPSVSPTIAPTTAPTIQSWQMVGSAFDGEGYSGLLGSEVSMSSDGSTVVASYKKRPYTDISGYAATAAIIFEEDATSKGNAIWHAAVIVEPAYCSDWSKAAMALAGNGKMAVLVSTGCNDEMDVAIWEKTIGSGEGGTTEGQESTELEQKWILKGSYSEPSASDSTLGVALSEDGSIVAIVRDGYVSIRERLYQTGPLSIRHSSAMLPSGKALSLSAKGDTVAFATFRVGGTYSYECIEVRHRDGSTGEWLQVENKAIVGRSAWIDSTSLSADGTVLAVVGAGMDNVPRSSHHPPDTGRVRVYRIGDGGNWTLMGQELNGGATDNFGGQKTFGGPVSLSHDGTHLAVGATKRSSVANLVDGMVQVFRFNAEMDEWVLLGGESIYGSESEEGFGTAISLSGGGRRIAVGAPHNRAGGNDAGRVSVFELNVS